MLVIDEAHCFWPQHQRSHSNPELVGSSKLKARIEKRTGWTSEQLEHRMKRYKKLPAAEIL